MTFRSANKKYTKVSARARRDKRVKSLSYKAFARRVGSLTAVNENAIRRTIAMNLSRFFTQLNFTASINQVTPWN